MIKRKKALVWTFISLLFWLSVWQLLSIAVGNQYLLPGIPKTLAALFDIFTSTDFYTSVGATVLRVLAGLLLAIFTGSILAVLSYKFIFVYKIFAPFITVIKSTPVATFIILLWVALSGNVLTVVIAFLMVMPIIFQNVLDGFNSINTELSEVCDIFGFSFFKRMKLLIIPTLFQYLVPAIISSTGLAWKAEIAAEIIGYTINSIGEWINDSKQNYDTARVFALTIIIIVLSIVLEKLTKFLLKKVSERKNAL